MKKLKKYRKLPVYGYSPKGRSRALQRRVYTPQGHSLVQLTTRIGSEDVWFFKQESYKTSYRTPNWVNLIRSGVRPLPQNNFSYTRVVSYDPVTQFDIGFYWFDGLIYHAGTYKPPYSPAPPHHIGFTTFFDDFSSEKVNLRNRVQNKLLTKLKSRKLNLGQFVAEWHQTQSLVLSTASKIANAAHHLRRFDVRGALRALDSGVSHAEYKKLRNAAKIAERKGVGGLRFLTDNWLSYQFGWKPLLQDIFSSCEVVYDGMRDASSTFTDVASTRYTISPREEQHNGPATFVRASAYKCSARCTTTYRIRNQGIEQSTSLGLLNPISLAWELVPYSFVVDWFFDVGKFLQDLDTTSGLEFLHGSVSTTISGEQRFIGVGTMPPVPVLGQDFSLFNFTSENRVLDKQRIILHDFPSFHMQGGSGLNSTKVLDSFSLAFQRLGDIFNHRR